MADNFFKYKGFIIVFTIIVVLIVTSNSGNYSFNFNLDGIGMVYFYIILLIIGFIYLTIRLIYIEIYFGENELQVNHKLFSLRIKSTKYDYHSIEKFIIGRITYKATQKYNIYIDHNSIIKKVNSYNEYRECIIILDKIKERAKKLVYDGTDENYFNEEDLFRDYYKIKRLVEEVKNEE